MEKYINKNGVPEWRGVSENSPFSDDMFHDVDMSFNTDNNKQLALYTNIGDITGFGYRDIETGYKDTDGKFWLASGDYNVIESDCKTVGDAIAWIKERANECVGVSTRDKGIIS
jgi:hypothetical protein